MSSAVVNEFYDDIKHPLNTVVIRQCGKFKIFTSVFFGKILAVRSHYCPVMPHVRFVSSYSDAWQTATHHKHMC